jgi:RNA polymerase sigma-70 factor, ECF subfamily
MTPPVPEQLSKAIETLYRSEPGRVLATLVRLLGDLDLAEESMHEAFAALESWTRTGIPDKPSPWLISTARFKAIDAMRRRARFDGAQRELVAHMESRANDAPTGHEEIGDEEIEDDRLRLLFTCCHPALPPEGQVALTLREICGLTTEEIARAFLLTPATLAQRIVHAKAKIQERPIPYEEPTPQELPERCGGSGGNAGRADRRGHSTGPVAGRTPAGGGSHWAACSDVAAGIPPRGEDLAGRRADFAGEYKTARFGNCEQIAEGVGLVEKALKSRRFSSYHCRQGLRQSMRRRNRPLRAIGVRLLRFTTNWYEFSLSQ